MTLDKGQTNDLDLWYSYIFTKSAVCTNFQFIDFNSFSKKVGQGQPRIIIRTNFQGVCPKCCIHLQSFKDIGPSVLEKKNFKRFLPYMGMAVVLVI